MINGKKNIEFEEKLKKHQNNLKFFYFNYQLKNFDEELVTKVKWIVLNKIDLLSKEDIDFLVETTKDLEKEFSIHTVSAKNRIGTEELVKEVGFYLENLNEEI